VFKAGARTLTNLEGVHPELAAAVLLAFKYTKQDFCIIDGGGLRTLEQATVNAARGVGVKNSLHRIQPDGFGHAVDLVAYQGGPSWDAKLYPPIREAMFRACDELGVLVQNGADWDNDAKFGERGEFDMPHFQLPQWPHSRDAARLAAERRRMLRCTCGR